MSDYISREKVLKLVAESGKFSLMAMIADPEIIPSADVRENIHGTWEEWKGKKFFDVPVCSNCGMTFSINARGWSFCPNCGAKMKGGE